MPSTTRPRIDEFLLAVLWTVTVPVWGVFGLTGYFNNLFGEERLNLPGFVVSFFFICLMVFGLRFSLGVYFRLLSNPPRLIDNAAPIVIGITLILGCLFSLFTLGVVVANLFLEVRENLLFAWGFAAAVGILLLSIYMLLVAANTLEPFLLMADNRLTKPPIYLRWMLVVSALKNWVIANATSHNQLENKLHGPLILETDTKSTVNDDKHVTRPGLEKMLVSHGGWHVNTLGFTANASVIFAASDGIMPHFQAGGRKGVLFPPEIKFWEWRTGKVQTVALGVSRTFITRNREVPPSLLNFTFLVPSGGGKFVWATGNSVRVGDWQDSSISTFEAEGGLVLKGYGGFLPLAINPEGTKFAWCDPTGQPRYQDLESNRVRQLRPYPGANTNASVGSENGIWGLVFSPDGTKIAIIGRMGVLLQNVYTGWRWVAELNPENERIVSFAFNHNGFEMAIGMMAKKEAIRNQRRYRNGKVQSGPLVLPEAHTDSAGEQWYGVIRAWDLRAADYTDMVTGNNPPLELVYSPDNRMMAAVDEAGVLRLWDLMPEGSAINPPRLFAKLELGITGRKTVVIFSPDMQRLICATDNRVLIWNIARVRQEWSPSAPANQSESKS